MADKEEWPELVGQVSNKIQFALFSILLQLIARIMLNVRCIWTCCFMSEPYLKLPLFNSTKTSILSFLYIQFVFRYYLNQTHRCGILFFLWVSCRISYALACRTMRAVTRCSRHFTRNTPPFNRIAVHVTWNLSRANCQCGQVDTTAASHTKESGFDSRCR